MYQFVDDTKQKERGGYLHGSSYLLFLHLRWSSIQVQHIQIIILIELRLYGLYILCLTLIEESFVCLQFFVIQFRNEQVSFYSQRKKSFHFLFTLEGRRPYRRRKLSSESDISTKYSADSSITSSPSSTTKYSSDDDVSSSSPEYSITRDAKKRKMDEDLTKHSSYKKYTCIEKNDVKSNKLKYSPQHAAFQEPTKDQISPLPDSTSQLDFNILLVCWQKRSDSS